MLLSKSVFILFFFCAYLSSQAQTYFGYRGGAIFAKVSTEWDGFIKDERRLGYYASVFFSFRNNKKLVFQPELSLAQKGFIERRWVKSSNRVTYLDLALLMNYKFILKDNNIRRKEKHIGYLIAGPYIGKLLSFKIKNLEGDGEVRDGVKDHLNQTDIGAWFGCGLGVPFGRGSLLFDLRYDLGIINANNGRIPGGYLRHQNIMIGAGYTFQLKK